MMLTLNRAILAVIAIAPPGGVRPCSSILERMLDWTRRWAMVLVVLAMLGWLWGSVLYFDVQQRARLLSDRTAELGLMSNAVAQHSAGLLRLVDSELQELDTWLVTHPGADPVRDPRFQALVDDMRHAGGGLIDFRIVSASGMMYLLPSPDGQPRVDVGDREYIAVHRGLSQARQMYIGAPVESRVDRRWYLPISMRLTTPPGNASDRAHAMQVLYATVGLERLAGEHESMRQRPDGAITLVRDDGLILSRAPIEAPYIGRDLSQSPHFKADFGANPRGTFISDGAMTDNVRRLVSYERLSAYPITVLVSRGYDGLFADHRARLYSTVALNGLMSVIVLGITAVFIRSRRTQRAMQSAQDELRRLATTDELTGVMNRRAFAEAAQREFARARRHGRPTAVLALDIDHFKLVNDDYGHANGDLVLRGCAARWQEALRAEDFLGRIGGEEFCVVLPETSEAHAQVIAERLRAITCASPMPGSRCVVTVSIGLTGIDAADPSWSSALDRADRMLYAAKTRGRNCIVQASAAT